MIIQKDKIIKTVIINLTILLVSLVAVFFSLEITIRLMKGELLCTDNQAVRKSTFLKSYYPIQFDKRLGWIPKPGASARSELWLGKKVNILDNGFRSNQSSPLAKNEPKIIALGDSLTFGDEVSDNETWPTQLEQLLGIQVLNGAVFGYGVDQIVLRAQILTEKHQPDILLIGVNYDDFDRCLTSVRSNAAKPYFVIEDNTLLLKNDHIMPLDLLQKEFTWFQKIFGHSYLVHSIMIRLDADGWLAGRAGNIRTNEDSVAIGQALLKQLSDLADSKNIKIVLIKLDPVYVREPEEIFKGIDLGGLEIVDMLPEFNRLREKDKDYFKTLFTDQGHLTSTGNLFVASKIYEELKMRGIISSDMNK